MTTTQPRRTAVAKRVKTASEPIRRDPWSQLVALAADSRTPLVAALVHLILVLGCVAIATTHSARLAVVRSVGYELVPMTGLAHYVLEPLRNWDGFWYTLIAEHGYGVHPAAAAFWPLYPMILRYLHDLTTWSVPMVGIIVSNVCFVAALIYLFRLVRLDYGESIAKRTIWLLTLFPTAFYFSAVYTESLYLLLTVGAIYYGRNERWGRAAIFGVLAALTRNTGVLVLIPLGWFIVRKYGWDPRRWWRIGAQLLAVALAPLLFLYRLDQIWGDWLLTLRVQGEWARYRAMPWTTLEAGFRQVSIDWLRQIYHHPSWATLTSAWVRWRFAESQFYDLFITVLFIPLTVYTFFKLRRPTWPAYGLYAAVVFVLPMLSPSHVHPLMSVPRFVIVLFPFFIAMALLLRRRGLYYAVLALFVIQFAALLIQFSTWFWVA